MVLAKLVMVVIDFVLLRVLMIAAALLVFIPFQCHYRIFGLNKVAVLCSGNLVPQVGTADGIHHDSLAAVHATIESVTLKQANGISVNFLMSPVEVHIPLIEGVSYLISNYFADIPYGVYVGATVVMTNAKAELENNPGVFVPVSLPKGGEFPVDVHLEVSSGVRGVLKLDLDNMKILRLGDSSLVLDWELRLETDIGPNDLFHLVFDAGNVETDGAMYSQNSNKKTFTMAFVDGLAKMSYVKWDYLVVDYAKASILLPPAVEGGEPLEGTSDDLAENASVHLTGALAVGGGDFMVLTADTVQIVAYDYQQ